MGEDLPLESNVSLAERLNAAAIDQSTVLGWASDLAAHIRRASNPDKIILFGSAATGGFRQGSDLDILLVFADQLSLRQARRQIRAQGPLGAPCPVDLLFVTQSHFDEAKDRGGVCFVAHHEGIVL